MKDKLTWQHVALIGTLLLVLGGLAWFGKDGSQVLAGVLAVMAALGFGFLVNKQNEIQASTARMEATGTEIKENTNGRIGKMQEMLERSIQSQQNAADQHRRDMKEMADKLAMMTPLAPVDPPVLGGESHPPNV